MMMGAKESWTLRGKDSIFQERGYQDWVGLPGLLLPIIAEYIDYMHPAKHDT